MSIDKNWTSVTCAADTDRIRKQGAKVTETPIFRPAKIFAMLAVPLSRIHSIRSETFASPLDNVKKPS